MIALFQPFMITVPFDAVKCGRVFMCMFTVCGYFVLPWDGMNASNKSVGARVPNDTTNEKAEKKCSFHHHIQEHSHVSHSLALCVSSAL